MKYIQIPGSIPLDGVVHKSRFKARLLRLRFIAAKEIPGTDPPESKYQSRRTLTEKSGANHLSTIAAYAQRESTCRISKRLHMALRPSLGNRFCFLHVRLAEVYDVNILDILSLFSFFFS